MLLAVNCVVDLDGVRVDVLQQLFVVAAPGVRDHLGNVTRAVHRPLQLFRDLSLRRGPAELGARHDFRALVPVSALKEDNIAELRQAIAAQLPASPALFQDGELTDRSVSFRIAEMIREQLTLELNQEVPYGVAVEVERLTEEDGQLTVDAAIWVDREGQKPIVIGAKGERLKRVGRAARLALNGLLGRRLHLNLWVKVRENWADNARALKELGLE